ncbi:MAG: DNA ligase D [Flavobacterium sp. 38-13]|uniref:DNA ligase D n=1 Tax=Flavobacterium sp. 38-13 TaxID=1896168 RepID=UPI00095B8DBD|nr:DNA ligase D [Flavobacterium sp. 38-13]OJX49768.1 MAG: DNA ligase D [Flavobacterium sp. 38-13]
MALEKYREKRDASKTPEPFGDGGNKGEKLIFVVQKHDASHLHYDFRLEMGGVLKSWAVPKGPSTDPKTKRLAMMVEDHPYDYKDFEGIIPKGQYGGGTVIVWDRGTYEPIEFKGTRKEAERQLLRQLHSGSLKIKLSGKKLKGEFALVKTHGMAENSWLLIKHDDRYSSPGDITRKGRSVISKKTIEQMEKSPDNVYGQKTDKKVSDVKSANALRGEARKAPGEQLGTKAENTKNTGRPISALLKGTPRQAFSGSLKPMLATLVDEPFDSKEWLYEVKWDGYRALAFLNKNKAELKSRNDKSFNEKFYPVYEALKKLNVQAVLDGEVVVVEENGKANFGKLQNWRSEADGRLVYYIFDILWLNGHDLKGLPLAERREILERIIVEGDLLYLSRTFDTSGIDFLEAAKKMGLEGIVAKKKSSTYHANERTRDWLKIKANRRQEVVIGGFTRNDDSSKLFSSLLVGVYRGQKLIYTGKVGTGFTDKMQKEMMAQFGPLVTEKVPFSSEPDVNKPSRFRPSPPHATATWLEPKLVAEVSYAEITRDGVMRHPSFEGMRNDKSAKTVVLEKESSTEAIVSQDHSKIIAPKERVGRRTLLNPSEQTQVKRIGGHELKFTNLRKVFWPTEKITKGQLINYYYQIAPVLLPYLKERPESMNRYPNGINGKSFYFKNVKGKVPDWMDTYGYHSEGDGEDKEYLIANNEATLLHMVNMGCIELNPWSSTAKRPDNPTFCIIDLDPDRNSFEQVIETARVTKEILDDMGVPSYPKTSGSTGLHIYIPLGGKYTYEQSREFARVIVTLVNRELPKFTTIERTISDRKGKMYLDFLQNRPHATIACAYSVRPKPGATVSMPLHWDEVRKGLQMSDFNIFNAVERVNDIGDIFRPVMGKGIDLKKVVAGLTKGNSDGTAGGI